MERQLEISEFLFQLESLWIENSELRFGQLIDWIVRNQEKDMFYISDERIKETIIDLMY